VVFDADWNELKLEENGYVIARLPRPHPKCRGKECAEESAAIRANGERLAALWNAAAAGMSASPDTQEGGPTHG
jgi:hypothetical protein